MNASAPMDVDKKFVMSIDNKSEEQREETHEHGGEAGAEDGEPVHNEEGGIACYIGQGGGGSWQMKGKGKGKGKDGGYKFQGQCWICGKTGHRSSECWMKGKGKGDMKGGGKGNYHWKGKGKGGKGLNAFDGQAWAPQPQATQQGQDQNRLMTNTWNGNPGNDWTAWNGQASNFGGLNLCTLATNNFKTNTCTPVTNKFKALETEDEDDDEETMKQNTNN